MAKAKQSTEPEVEVVEDDPVVDLVEVLGQCESELEGKTRGEVNRYLVGRLGDETVADRLTSELFSGGGV